MKSAVLMLSVLSLFTCLTLVNIQDAHAVDHSTVKIYPAGSFSTGWTHAVDTANGVLWYNSLTGSGVLGRVDGAGNHTSFKTTAFSKGWTHIVNTAKGVLWYNSQTGAGALGEFDSAGNYTNTRTFSFSPGWSSVVSTSDRLLWYNAKTGAAVAGRLE